MDEVRVVIRMSNSFNIPLTLIDATPQQAHAMMRATQQFEQIETARVIARPLGFDDVDALVALLSNPRVSGPITLFPQPFLESSGLKWVNDGIEKCTTGTGLHLGVFYRDNGMMIGEYHVNLWPEHVTGKFGGCLATAYWGKGLAEEISVALSSWLYDTAAASLLCLTTAEDNYSSQRMILELGFKFIRPYDRPVTGSTVRPSLYYEQTADEWQRHKPGLLQRLADSERYTIKRQRGLKPEIPGQVRV